MQNIFSQESSSYFKEEDTKEYRDSLMTPFDDEGVQMIVSILNRKHEQQLKNATQTLTSYLKGADYKDQKITPKLYIMFEKIGFSCGIQAFKFISFKPASFKAERKTRSPILENAISQFCKNSQKDGFQLIAQSGIKFPVAMVADKSVAYANHDSAMICNIFTECMPFIDRKYLKKYVEAKKAENKGVGTIVELVKLCQSIQ